MYCDTTPELLIIHNMISIIESEMGIMHLMTVSMNSMVIRGIPIMDIRKEYGCQRPKIDQTMGEEKTVAATLVSIPTPIDDINGTFIPLIVS